MFFIHVSLSLSLLPGRHAPDDVLAAWLAFYPAVFRLLNHSGLRFAFRFGEQRHYAKLFSRKVPGRTRVSGSNWLHLSLSDLYLRVSR